MSASSFKINQLAIPAVSALITFLAYSSQYLFRYIEPEPLTTSQLIKFNTLLCCLWICYGRACAVDPGRIPLGWKPSGAEKDVETKANAVDHNDGDDGNSLSGGRRQRWCRRCEALKPPRAHHCKTCQR
ncbi:Palmitoyltransferase [Arachnomyces sp. PD_36]|nr:Palmitoyltransferase [Arachnomyces sp. PD_36]